MRERGEMFWYMSGYVPRPDSMAVYTRSPWSSVNPLCSPKICRGGNDRHRRHYSRDGSFEQQETQVLDGNCYALILPNFFPALRSRQSAEISHTAHTRQLFYPRRGLDCGV